MNNPPTLQRPARRSSVASALAALALFFAFVVTLPAADEMGRVSRIRVPGALKVIKAQLGANGTIHVLADSERGPEYLSTADGGRTFSAPIPVLNAAPRKPGLKFLGWDLAVAGDGRVHVAMSNNAWQLKLPQDEWGYFYASLAPGAKTFSPLRNLNHKPSEGFSLAAGERGVVTASFLSGKLYTMTSHDGGETFGAFAEPNPAWDPCNCCTTSTAYGKDGRLALLYREETNNDRDIYLGLVDQARGGTPARARVSGGSWKFVGCPMTYYTVAPTLMGYVAAWPTKGEIYFAQLDKDGKVLPPGEIKTPGRSGMRTGVQACTATDGTTLVAWKNNEQLGWQLYDAQGRPQGSAGSAASPGTGAAAVVLGNGRFILFL
jgi:hypothetical protein